MEKTIGTLEESALLSGGAIVGAYLLDRDTGKLATMFNLTPNSFIYNHWGAGVAVVSAYASTKVTNPYVKGALVGVCIYGILQEAENDFGWNNSVSPPVPYWGPIGNGMTEEMNKKLKDAAAKRLGAGNIIKGKQNVILGLQYQTKGYAGVGLGGGLTQTRITQGYSGVGNYRKR